MHESQVQIKNVSAIQLQDPWKINFPPNTKYYSNYTKNAKGNVISTDRFHYISRLTSKQLISDNKSYEITFSYYILKHKSNAR